MEGLWGPAGLQGRGVSPARVPLPTQPSFPCTAYSRSLSWWALSPVPGCCSPSSPHAQQHPRERDVHCPPSESFLGAAEWRLPRFPELPGLRGKNPRQRNSLRLGHTPMVLPRELQCMQGWPARCVACLNLRPWHKGSCIYEPHPGVGGSRALPEGLGGLAPRPLQRRDGFRAGLWSIEQPSLS